MHLNYLYGLLCWLLATLCRYLHPMRKKHVGQPLILLCSVLGGHYIAYCRNELNQLWYEFDDQSVTEVSESCVQNAEAYVLFYK